MANEKRHIELGVSSCFGYRETVITPDDVVDFAVKNGSNAVAITDFDSVHSVLKLSEAVKSANAGIKAIFGVRLLCHDKNGGEFFITLLAKTRHGLRNVYLIISAGYRKAATDLKNDQRPYIDWDLVLKYKEDVLIGRECTWDHIQSFVNKSEADVRRELSSYLTASITQRSPCPQKARFRRFRQRKRTGPRSKRRHSRQSASFRASENIPPR